MQLAFVTAPCGLEESGDSRENERDLTIDLSPMFEKLPVLLKLLTSCTQMIALTEFVFPTVKKRDTANENLTSFKSSDTNVMEGYGF